MVEAEIVHVEAHLMDGFNPIGLVADITVPAFTREPEALGTLLVAYWAEYLMRSAEEEMGCSLADFAFFLLSKASDEPRRFESNES